MTRAQVEGSGRDDALMKPHILVVEDEDDIVTLLRYTLEREGFRVSAATNGEEALLLCREQMPDLVLLDWMLPLLSGSDVCRQLRRTDDTAEIPVIMLTARGEETDRVRGLNAGADDYITKPFSLVEGGGKDPGGAAANPARFPGQPADLCRPGDGPRQSPG